MLRKIEQTLANLNQHPKHWLVTGAAGFIGSNLTEFLLSHNQRVTGLDNFATGYQHNLDEIKHQLHPEQWKNFKFIEGDIRSLDTCNHACEEIDFVLHHAALGSIPRSINNPIATNEVNVGGFLNMLVAARDAKVKSFTYAGSSSTYGDNLSLPKREDIIGKPLSPYGVTKYVNELYAKVFADIYHFPTIGLRYFNVFGPRQNRYGAYTAVIPTWIMGMIKGEEIFINGDGEQSRDFCFIENVIEANLLAATTENEEAKNQIYNVALNDTTSLNRLFMYLKQGLEHFGIFYPNPPTYREARQGDVANSQAEIVKAKQFLGYEPIYKIQAGLEKTLSWYIQHV